MKKNILGLAALFVAGMGIRGMAQVPTLVKVETSIVSNTELPPVRWTYSLTRVSKTEGVLTMQAVIEKGWHIYTQKVEKEGPVKTSFTIKPSSDYTLIGSPEESPSVVRQDQFFLFKVNCFENEAIFKQKIRLNKAHTIVKGSVEYMAAKGPAVLPVKHADFSVEVK